MARCESPSQFGASGTANEVQGMSRNASVWGLAIGSGSVPPRVGDELKIVWRVTGSGPLRVTFTGPDDAKTPLVFGPERHSASSYKRPGAEWGTGFRFTRAGCWHIRLARTNASGDVWLRVDA